MVKLPKIDPGKTMNFKIMILILNPSVKKEVLRNESVLC